jgi:hypothetical protein
MMDTFGATEIMLDEHGGRLAVRGKDLRQTTLANLLGVLLLGIDLEPRHELLRSVEQSVREGVCPALVGSIVRRAERLTGIWPLVMPLARYAAGM